MRNDPSRRAGLLRQDPIDLAHKEDCQEAAAYRSWIKRIFPEILSSTDTAELDVAQLRIAQEYNQRRRGHSFHRFDVCLPDVFHEWMDLLWDRQRSVAPRCLFPAPPAPPAQSPIQALYLGEEEDQPVRAFPS